jgi:hypothetical protein
MSSLPLELLTLIGSGIFGAVTTFIGMAMKNRAEVAKLQLQALTAKAAISKDVREYGSKDKGFAYTRRAIALMSVFSILVLPKFAAWLDPSLTVLVGYTEVEGSLISWLFCFDTSTVKWRPVVGLVITPLDTHVVSSIIGLYFGASMAKNS